MELARLLAQIDDTLLGELFSANALTRARGYVGRVRNIETAMIQKVLSLDSEKNANAVLVDLEEYTDTNLDMASVGYLLVDFIANREEVTIYSTTGPYAGGENAEGLWVVQEDPAAWAELMAVVDAGEDPEGIVKLPSHS